MKKEKNIELKSSFVQLCEGEEMLKNDEILISGKWELLSRGLIYTYWNKGIFPVRRKISA